VIGCGPADAANSQNVVAADARAPEFAAVALVVVAVGAQEVEGGTEGAARPPGINEGVPVERLIDGAAGLRRGLGAGALTAFPHAGPPQRVGGQGGCVLAQAAGRLLVPLVDDGIVRQGRAPGTVRAGEVPGAGAAQSLLRGNVVDFAVVRAESVFCSLAVVVGGPGRIPAGPVLSRPDAGRHGAFRDVAVFERRRFSDGGGGGRRHGRNGGRGYGLIRGSHRDATLGDPPAPDEVP